MMYKGMHRKLKETTGGWEVVIKTNIPVARTGWEYGPVAPPGDGLWREAHLRCSLGQKETRHKILRGEHLDFSFSAIFQYLL